MSYQKALTVLLFLLSASIASYIIITQTAPWRLIAVYWLILTVKYGLEG